MGVFYATREEVQSALDVKEAAHDSGRIDRAIEAGSRAVDQLLNRHRHGLAPRTATRYFPWPDGSYTRSYRLWLDENELISATSVVSGGTTIAATDYFLEPVNSGPPYTHLEIDLSSSASLSSGSGTHQRAVEISGLWGHSNVQAPAGALDEALDSSETAVDVTNASLIGVGSVLTVDSERMIVTDRTSKSTFVTLTGGMNALKNDQTVEGVSGGFFVGEIILVDSERMKIIENNGVDLTVIRGYDGTTLASHSTGATIYAYRTLTVERGALGTTAASHLTSTAITKWVVPDPARVLAIAEAITIIEQEMSAYGRRVGSDEAERDASGTEVFTGRGLGDLRKICRMSMGRKFRKRAV